MKKTFLFAVILLSVVFIFTACSSDLPEEIVVHGSFIAYNSVEELSVASTYVIRAEVLDERVEKVNTVTPPDEPFYDIVTIYRVLVLEVFQGDAVAGEIMEIRRSGGELNGQVVHSHDQVLTIGDELLLFVYQGERWVLPPVLLNPLQAAYQLPSERTEGADDLNSELESLNPDNTLTLTLGDLLDLQYENFGEISESFAELFEDGVLDAWRE